MESPCYNKETKTDCPRRKAGCAVTCVEWSKYLKARDKEYDERKRNNDIKQILMTTTSSNITRVQRKHRSGAWHRKVFKDQ